MASWPPLRLALLAQVLGLAYASSLSCTSGFVPLAISTSNQRFNLTKFESELDVSNYFRQSVSVGSNLTAQITLPGVDRINATYDLWTKTCVPKNWNGVVEILVHGIGGTHSFFEYADDPTYSYLEQATKRGNAVVSYDRLGIGKSDHPNALSVVQYSVDAEILHQLVLHVKSDRRFAKAKSFVGLGHSYGSSLLTAIASLYPTLLDKIILTGFSLSRTSVPDLLLALSSFIAADQSPTVFRRYKNDTGYLTTESAPHDLSAFFDRPHYVPGVFEAFTSGKGIYSIGQLITIGGPAKTWPVQNFTGSVLVVTGEHDIAFCGGNCWQKPSLTNGTSLLSDVETIFPAVTKFSTFIPPNTGHAVFQHFSAPQVFSIINQWLEGTYV